MQAAYTMQFGYLARIGTSLRIHLVYKFAHLHAPGLGFSDEMFKRQAPAARRRFISVKIGASIVCLGCGPGASRRLQCSRREKSRLCPSGSTVAEHWQATFARATIYATHGGHSGPVLQRSGWRQVRHLHNAAPEKSCP
jgi:hypothetical protein